MAEGMAMQEEIEIFLHGLYHGSSDYSSGHGNFDSWIVLKGSKLRKATSPT